MRTAKCGGIDNMRNPFVAVVVVFLVFSAPKATVSGENRTAPALELLTATRLADARSSEQSFELRATIKLHPEKAAAAQGIYLLVWASPTRWREEVSFPDFHQVRVSAPGGVWEQREPFFLSLRMWQFMQALNFYGRLQLPKEDSTKKIKLRKKEGSTLRCVEITRGSDFYPLEEFCFRKDLPELVSEHYVPSDRTYEFADYRNISGKFFPG